MILRCKQVASIPLGPPCWIVAAIWVVFWGVRLFLNWYQYQYDIWIITNQRILDSRKATTHWRYTEKLRTRFPEIEVVPDVLYVDQGNVLT